MVAQQIAAEKPIVANAWYEHFDVTTGMPGAPNLDVRILGFGRDPHVTGQVVYTHLVNPPITLTFNNVNGQYAWEMGGHDVVSLQSEGNFYMIAMLEPMSKKGTANYKVKLPDGKWEEHIGVPVIF
jgi:hypothetical protein